MPTHEREHWHWSLVERCNMTTYQEIESLRHRFMATWRTRSGLTPVQYAALATIHNGCVNETILMAPKACLRALAKKGLIDAKGRCTKAGEDLCWEWVCEDRERRQKVQRAPASVVGNRGNMAAVEA